MKLSIIVPIFNEQETLAPLVDRIRRVVSGRWSYELILVDDMSTDRSSNIIREQMDQYGDIVAIIKSVNRGKGRAVREGLRHASGDIILIQDADLEYSPEDYPALLEPILAGEASVVYGSRFLATKPVMKPLSAIANRLLTFMTNVLYGARLTDMETCYKVFKAGVVRSLPLEANRFDIETELTAKVLLSGCRIREIPIQYDARTKAEGKKIGWRDGLAAVRSLWRYRFRPSQGEAANEIVLIFGKNVAE